MYIDNLQTGVAAFYPPARATGVLFRTTIITLYVRRAKVKKPHHSIAFPIT